MGLFDKLFGKKRDDDDSEEEPQRGRFWFGSQDDDDEDDPYKEGDEWADERDDRQIVEEDEKGFWKDPSGWLHNPFMGSMSKEIKHNGFIEPSFTEDGDSYICPACDEPGEVYFNPKTFTYKCLLCDTEFTRKEHLENVNEGCMPDESYCIYKCSANYPACKEECIIFDIDKDDDPYFSS